MCDQKFLKNVKKQKKGGQVGDILGSRVGRRLQWMC